MHAELGAVKLAYRSLCAFEPIVTPIFLPVEQSVVYEHSCILAIDCANYLSRGRLTVGAGSWSKNPERPCHAADASFQFQVQFNLLSKMMMMFLPLFPGMS